MVWKLLAAHECREELNAAARTEQLYNMTYKGDNFMLEFFTKWTELIHDPDVNMTDAGLLRILLHKLRGRGPRNVASV